MRTFSKSAKINTDEIREKVLNLVHRQPGIEIDEVARIVDCSPQSAGFKDLIRRLETEGEVVRTFSVLDKRKVALLAQA
jgi:DNA-binding Lrp family transcriptional regulator